MDKPTNLSSKGWYSIHNQVQGPTKMMIYNDIGAYGISADDFRQDLRNVKGDIDLHLNTLGGSVSDGIAIHNALKQHPGKVTVIVDGWAASIGSVIAMAGDEVNMGPGSSMMIHEAHGASEGDASAMSKFSNVLEKQSDEIAGFYARKTGTPASYWRDQMKQETWYSAQEAVDAGLADRVIGGYTVTNRVPAEKPESHCELLNIKHPHGDVPYADPGYLDADGEQVSKSGKEGVARYPIDEEHVQAAWSYINQEKNASQYTAEQLAAIKSKIRSAMKKFGHDVSEDNSLFIQIQATLKEVFA